MLDIFHLPQPNNPTFWFFHNDVGSATNNDWIVWPIPRGLSCLAILATSGGGGGGGGHTAAAGVARGGGGGGGASGVTRVMIPRLMLPDTIYIKLGRGGAGGGATQNGAAGGFTSVSTAPTSVGRHAILSPNSGGLGNAGTVATGGAAGSAGTAESAVVVGGTLGQWTAIVGQAGAVGGAHTGAIGGSVTWGTIALTLSGGAGGGGTPTGNTNFAGGTITNIPIVPGDTSVTYTLPGGVAAGGAGSDGLWQMRAWNPCFTGGTGGGTNGAAGTAGAGGIGAPGCGGGGGGGGVTGGAGGAGGSGFVIITGW